MDQKQNKIVAYRYFILSAIYSHNIGSTTFNFGTKRNVFPTNKQCREIVLELRGNENPKDIVILSISEVSKEDYITFWSES